MTAIVDRLWRPLLRPLLFRLEPERAHRLALAVAAIWSPRVYGAACPELAQRLWGLEFSNPLGLAAGLDKEVKALGAWQAIGLGFVEVGTITPCPQPGNPPPRLWRLPDRCALINRLGFPSSGMQAAARRLARWRRRGIRIPVAVNLGPNKNTVAERIAEDYAALVNTLGPLADLLVINVSSPNTPGLRDWQAPAQLSAIAAAIGKQGRPPALLKVAPDLSASQVDEIARCVLELGFDGVVATNTSVARGELGVDDQRPGGLSGKPLRERSRQVIAEIYRATRGSVPIVGVGGIGDARDAFGHILAGASLIEIYTALIYQGPGLPARLCRGLAELIRRAGFASIAEAVGQGADRRLPDQGANG